MNPQTSLINGVPLQPIGQHSTPHPVLHINTGIQANFDTMQNMGGYFPLDSWRPPTAEELAMLSKSQPTALHEAVTIVEISSALADEFWQEVFPRVYEPETPPDERMQLLNQFGEKVLNYLTDSAGLVVESMWTCDVVINQPSQISTAYNHEQELFLGLHIDNHEHLQLEERKKGFRLLSINMGQSPRYLNYVNLTATGLLEALQLQVNPDTERQFRHPRTLRKLFFDTFPSYPVCRVTLKPNTGYILVTQNVIHDGATNSEGDPDVALMIGGDFFLPSQTE